MAGPTLVDRFRTDGYVVVRGLITGDDLQALDRLVDRTLDGELVPVSAYKGWLPPQFYTHWEPGFEEREELPRRDRVRSMAVSAAAPCVFLRKLQKKERLHRTCTTTIPPGGSSGSTPRSARS